jgi:hypothetical protein
VVVIPPGKLSIRVNELPTCGAKLAEIRVTGARSTGEPSVFTNLQPWFGLREIDIGRAL